MIQLSDWFYGPKHSEITQKKIKQFYIKTMVHFCKGCDVHVFFVEEVIEAVSSIAKRWPSKIKIKGIVHPKMIILSFTHPQVVPNLYECLCSEHKGRYSEESGKQSSSGASLTSIVFIFPTMIVNGAPKTAWLQTFFRISSFVFRHSYKWNYLRASKWQNDHFWVNYPFNLYFTWPPFCYRWHSLYNFFNKKHVDITTLTKMNHGFYIKLLNFLLCDFWMLGAFLGKCLVNSLLNKDMIIL